MATRLRRTVFLLIATLGALAAMEATWRALVAAPADLGSRRAFVQRSLRLLEPCACRSAAGWGRRLHGCHAENTGGDFDVPLERPDGALRIVVVGESSATMLASAMHDLVRLSPDGAEQHIEVLNCSDPGSGLEHVQARAREALTMNPDVVVVVFGHNLAMKYPVQRSTLLLQRWLLASRLVAGLADSLSVAWQQSLESASDREALLRSWLETLSRDAERAGIAVVLSTVASNLWFPPDIDAGERQDPAVLEASLLDARRATDESVATLQALVDRAPTPYRHYLLGRRLAKGGRAEAAARHLDAAIETSRRDPDRAPRAVNEVLRSMEGRNGVVLHDTMQRMAERSPSGLPGWNVLRDHCHLQPALWTEEARAVLQTCIELARDPAIEEIAIARDRPSGWDSLLEPARGLVLAQEAAAPPRVERFQRAFVTLVQQHAEREPARTRRRLQRWLEESSQLATATSSERTAIVVAIADGFVEAGRLRAALRTNAWVRREPSAAVWTQLGRIRLARGRQAAARRAFEHAIAVDARDIEARFFRDRLAAGPKVEHGR